MRAVLLCVLGICVFIFVILLSMFIIRVYHDIKIPCILLILNMLLFIPYVITSNSTNETVSVETYELVPIRNVYIVSNPADQNQSIIYYYKDNTIQSLILRNDMQIQNTYDENYVKIITTRKTWWCFYKEGKAYIVNIMNNAER